MMNGRAANLYFDGTSALKLEVAQESLEQAKIIPFPKRMEERTGTATQLDSIAAAAKRAVTNVLHSSEMYCSLKFEDFRGCSYHIFTNKGIAVLSASASLIAVVSILASL